MAFKLLRCAETQARVGKPKSSLYRDIALKLFPPGVAIGAKSVAWPEYEVDEINAARIAGKSDDEIRQLVKHLLERRKEVAC